MENLWGLKNSEGYLIFKTFETGSELCGQFIFDKSNNQTWGIKQINCSETPKRIRFSRNTLNHNILWIILKSSKVHTQSVQKGTKFRTSSHRLVLWEVNVWQTTSQMRSASVLQARKLGKTAVQTSKNVPQIHALKILTVLKLLDHIHASANPAFLEVSMEKPGTVQQTSMKSKLL